MPVNDGVCSILAQIHLGNFTIFNGFSQKANGLTGNFFTLLATCKVSIYYKSMISICLYDLLIV